jgi:hypothetical protein
MTQIVHVIIIKNNIYHMMINPTELEKKLFNSISEQKNNQNCHEIKINKKLPVKNKTDIKPVTSEKEGYADACTIIPQHEIMIYNVVKRVINDNKINDYNSIPLLVKRYITEKLIETKLIKDIDEETFIELASYFNQVKNQDFFSFDAYKDYAKIYVKVKRYFEELAQKDLEPLGDIKPEQKYEMVNHPTHYNNYDKEVIEMMIDIWGPEETAIFCKLNAFKYRLRMGTKPDNDIKQDLNKEKWYLKKFHELKNLKSAE